MSIAIVCDGMSPVEVRRIGVTWRELLSDLSSFSALFDYIKYSYIGLQHGDEIFGSVQ